MQSTVLNRESAHVEAPSNKIHQHNKDTDFLRLIGPSIDTIESELSEIDSKLSSSKTFIPPTNSEYEEVLKAAKVDLSLPLEQPAVCMAIIDEGKEAIIGTYGNFAAYIGKAKGGKTYGVSLGLSALVKNDLLFDKIQPYFLPGKNVIKWYDTEQGRYHVQKVGKRVLHVAEKNEAPNFEILCFRALDTKQRLAAIEYDIYSTKNLAVVVIDGIRDLISDINNADEATMITSKLLKWSEELSIHIIIILHQNKGDNNARGHVGTEVINKAEAVISVTKDQENDLFIVEPERCREREFKPYAFAIDEKGMPYILDQWQPKGEVKKDSLEANNIPDDFHKERIKEAFKIDPRPSYKAFWTNLQTAFAGYHKVSDSKAKRFLSYYQQKQWVAKIDPPQSGKSWALYKSNSLV